MGDLKATVIDLVQGEEDLKTRTMTNNNNKARKSQKRKRASVGCCSLSDEDRESQLNAYTKELDGLFNYYREVVCHKPAALAECNFNHSNLNQKVATVTEESDLPLSKLVIYVKEKIGGDNNVSEAAVKSSVLSVAQRLMYGVPNPDADILEDHSPSSLWCWETRDLKLIPKSARDTLKIRRTCRKKIHERITAVSAMINALKKSYHREDYERDLLKASEKLNKVLSEVDIRLLVEGLFQKTSAETSEMEAKPEDKLSVKQFEKSIRESEKEKKKMEREVQKEKLQREREQKRLQEEAEKDERRREREEAEMRKLLKKQLEEAEREQRRREKEEAEMKKQLSLKKQASIMERFLKKSKTDACQNDHSSTKVATDSESLGTKSETASEAVTQSMDCTLLSNETVSVDDIRRSHLSSWRQLGRYLRSDRNQHWGIRKKPKTQLYKEIKLCTMRGHAQDDEWSMEKLVDEWEEQSSVDRSCLPDATSCPPGVKKCIRRWQLLQFDKSYRPAFYGIWPKKSHVVGPRCPFRKDPNLDYDIDSDEEWEEEDPGESLSDCDKDDEECVGEGCSKADDEDDSDDGFFVPDGYLSENEGVQVDRMEPDISEEAMSVSCKQNAESVDFALAQQQKYLNNLTEHALRKNQPLIILNFRHEKAKLFMEEKLSGVSKLEQSCLRVLSMHVYPIGPPIEVSISNLQDDEKDNCSVNRADSAIADSAIATIDESRLPTIVSAIQSCPQGIKKVVESLQEKFPTTPKKQLKDKVREVSEFVDNRWQVKKDILEKLGLSISPAKSSGRTKSIATFFSKRCLPPADKSINSNDNTPR